MGQFMCKRLLWTRKEVRVLMLGLDAAGKTTILYTLKLGEIVTTIPTIGFNVETVDAGNQKLTVWDIGGRCKMRPLYRHYYASTDAVIYVIDSGDRERLEEAVYEFQLILDEEVLKDSKFLVLCNKQDLDNVMSVDDIKSQIKPNSWQNVGFFPVSAMTNNTLKEPLEWLTNEIANKNTGQLVEASLAEVKEMVKPITTPTHYLKKSWTYITSFLPG